MEMVTKPHLDSLERAEEDIGDELSGGRAGEVDAGLVLGGVLRASEVGIVPIDRGGRSKNGPTLGTARAAGA